ncbi:MAG: hypothetical protein GKR87_05685 [Kiritimatiellae bacterium]|nr:hypothetical protein [Kiritimatiellia bacterium]
MSVFSKKIILIGVGGGGINAVSNMTVSCPEGPEVIAIDTDSQVLSSCAVPQQVRIGSIITDGLSAGGKMDVGGRALESDELKIRGLFHNVKFVFLVVALGGGTGTGAAPMIARIAQEEGAMVLSFLTLPFSFEGEQRRRQAEEGASRIKAVSDAIIYMPNERLLEPTEREESLVNIFERSDLMIGMGVRSLWNLLTYSGIMNLDFSDIRSVTQEGGCACSFAYAEASGTQKTKEAIEKIMQSPYLERGNVLAQAKRLLVGISGDSNLALKDIQEVMTEITSVIPGNAHMTMGAAIDDKLENQISITVLASEIAFEEKASEDPEEKTGLLFDDEVLSDIEMATPKKGPVLQQINLNLELAGKEGRFKDVEPTYYHGEDLDIPTFTRCGIKLSN